ncbi:hypothetical protein [Avibacterium volantium]|uniref:hypothetical protein n=1 Tax=Avibacterium TaxID=292486 RepID=UPI003BF90CE5
MKGKLENLFFRKFQYIDLGNEYTPEENESKGNVQIKNIQSGFNQKDSSFNGLFSLNIVNDLFFLTLEVHGEVTFPSDSLPDDISNKQDILEEIIFNSLELISKETNNRLNEFLKWSPTQLEESIEFWKLNKIHR